MDNYRQRFEELANENQPTDLVVQIHTWEENDELYGELISIDLVQTAKMQEACNGYILQTDDGPTSCMLGNATDKQLEGKLHIGDLVYIKFHGKIAIQGGAKQVNKFIVQAIPADEWKTDVVPTTDSIVK